MKLVIFDCDGVLIDSEAIYANSEIEFLSNAGIQFERRAYMEAFMGLSPEEWRAKIETAAQERNGHSLPKNFFDSLHPPFTAWRLYRSSHSLIVGNRPI